MGRLAVVGQFLVKRSSQFFVPLVEFNISAKLVIPIRYELSAQLKGASASRLALLMEDSKLSHGI